MFYEKKLGPLIDKNYNYSGRVYQYLSQIKYQWK